MAIALELIVVEQIVAIALGLIVVVAVKKRSQKDLTNITEYVIKLQ
ncbi:MAG: hypothetical protein KME06_03930 [Kastovskya adunca ATA6-11-RM4]|nr:hypothetical protein [Kastovskya adunca ATA6-11-RM4]